MVVKKMLLGAITLVSVSTQAMEIDGLEIQVEKAGLIECYTKKGVGWTSSFFAVLRGELLTIKELSGNLIAQAHAWVNRQQTTVRYGQAYSERKAEQERQTSQLEKELAELGCFNAKVTTVTSPNPEVPIQFVPQIGVPFNANWQALFSRRH